jgi:non-ribosomal peptide synthetase component F
MPANQDLSLVRSFEKGPSTICPFPTVTAAFYNYAVNYPDAVAARDMSTSPMRELSYRELAQEAQSLARNLRQLGVSPSQRVPLFVKRGLEMVVSIWAVLSCGAQYVPLDGGVVSESTIRTVVGQSSGKVVICIPLTEQRLKGFQGLGDIVPVVVEFKEQDVGVVVPEKFIDLATANSGCYVIYTSGAPPLITRGSHTVFTDTSPRNDWQAQGRGRDASKRCQPRLPGSGKPRRSPWNQRGQHFEHQLRYGYVFACCWLFALYHNLTLERD